jgi:hypothetical protein
VSLHPTRKQFFAKLAGGAAAVAVIPKVFARSGAPAQVPASDATPVKVRPDTRAIARRADSV